jgi:DNA (cytosine-5)-methyltransferase 1
MKHIGLFEGIGGFSLAARWAGWETIAWCEWNDFGQKVLRHHFPKAQGHGDITQTDFTIYRGQCDIVTGGFPCQPYSTAGKRLGKEDERHLWPEMLRAIREIQPRWVVGENVLGLVNWSGGLVFHEVQADLEAAGYEVFPYVLPACAVNAPHRRDRVWFVAKNTKRNGFLFGEPNKEGTEVRQFGNPCTGSSYGIHISKGAAANAHILGHTPRATGAAVEGIGSGDNGKPKERSKQTERADGLLGLQQLAPNPDNCGGKESGVQHTDLHTEHSRSEWSNFPTQPPVCSRNDGISSRLDGITFPKWRNESIKAAGNAIVPQVAFQIFQAINQYETK